MKNKAEKKVLVSPETQAFARETLEAIAIALVLALIIREFGVQSFKIPSGSMKQTLLVGDFILVNKFKYGVKIPFTDTYLIRFSKPQRGDVIVFKFPNNPRQDYIKRVVGVEGDRIEIKKKVLHVNGEPVVYEQVQNARSDLMAPYGSTSDNRDFFGPITVKPGHLFVLGDNRDNSHDSRFWGELPVNNVRGEAFMVYFSWDSTIERNWGFLDSLPIAFDGGVRWGRFGRILY